MKKIIRVEQAHDAPLNLTWVINTMCTNHCSYCPPNLHTGTNHNYDWDNARKFLHEVISRYKKIKCVITGGEPTMSPFLPELVDIIYNSGGTVSLSTNGSQSTSYWSEIAKKITWIDFSYHPEYPAQQYFENINVAKHLTQVNASIMMLSSHWDQCIDVFERLNADDKHMTIAVRITNWLGPDNNGSDSYTDEQLRWFNRSQQQTKNKYSHLNLNNVHYQTKIHMSDGSVEVMKNNIDYINNRQTVFTGYHCEIGLKSLYVTKNGDIRRGNCWEGGTIGNINQVDSIQWPDRPVICRRDSCDCGTDVVINKWINE